MAARSSATSAAARRSSGVVVAVANPTIAGPSGPSTTASAESRPCAMPAACRVATCCHSVSSVASAIVGPDSPRRGPATERVATSARRPSAAPAASRAGTGTPTAAARSNANPSCSTCWRRVTNSTGFSWRYAIHRQVRARSWPSISSRPRPVTWSAPPSSVPTNALRPVGWRSARSSVTTFRPSRASASRTDATDGRDIGTPNARCTAAAAAQPSTIAASRSPGSAVARNRAATVRSPTVT